MGRALCSGAASLSFVRESQIRSSRNHQDARLQLALTVSLARLRHVDPTPVGECKKNNSHAAVNNLLHFCTRKMLKRMAAP